METEEIQNKIVEVAEKRAKQKGYKINKEISTIQLMEELGEIASQLFSEKARKEKFSEENLKEEICNIILESSILAKILNVNLSEELNKKI